jgi:holo-[acyl-carrier protein] synthase
MNAASVWYQYRMLVGSGIDAIEIVRIAAAIQQFGDRFCRRVYSPAEIAYCRSKRNAAESFAARFAAKEAAAKALGTGIHAGVGWRDIEVTRSPGGRPGLRFHGRALGFARHLRVANAALSLTHSRELAFAQVLLEDAAGDDGRPISAG